MDDRDVSYMTPPKAPCLVATGGMGNGEGAIVPQPRGHQQRLADVPLLPTRSDNVQLRHPLMPSAPSLLLLRRLTAGHTEAREVVAGEVRRFAATVAVRRPAAVR